MENLHGQWCDEICQPGETFKSLRLSCRISTWWHNRNKWIHCNCVALNHCDVITVGHSQMASCSLWFDHTPISDSLANNDMFPRGCSCMLQQAVVSSRMTSRYALGRRRDGGEAQRMGAHWPIFFPEELRRHQHEEFCDKSQCISLVGGGRVHDETFRQFISNAFLILY